MKRLLITLMLALISTNAMAAWIGIASTDEFISYVDFPPISHIGSKVKMWVLYDYQNANAYGNGKKYLSVKYQNEFDCNERKYRVLLISFHSSNMGNGEIIARVDTPNNWQSAPPDSMEDAELTIACGTK